MEPSPPGSPTDPSFAAPPPEPSLPFAPEPEAPPEPPTQPPSTQAIGSSGIRVESFAVGGPQGLELCGGEPRFSVEAEDRAYVCFEVVHARREEDVTVVWSRDETVERRTRVEIAPERAQLSRVHLAATTERIGQWTVRLEAGAEVLAEGAFEIVR